jgi:type IV secretory pathway VirJ component
MKCSGILLSLFLIAFPVLAEIYPVDRVGNLHVFGSAEGASSVVILISGSNGWDEQMEKIAMSLASRHVLVGGLDLNEYLSQFRKNKLCPPYDLDQTGKILEKRAGMKQYLHATIVGYREGAGLVLLAHAEAPGIFSGALSIGFCPKLPIAPEKTCGGEKIFSGQDPIRLVRPWVLLEGVGESCNLEETVNFQKRVEISSVVNAKQDWLDQLNSEVEKLRPADSKKRLTDLPLIEYEGDQSNSTLVIFYSGDGGWGELEDEMSRYYQKKGIASIGFDSLRYFWNAPDPSQAGKDLGRAIVEYSNAWKRPHIILVGYSYGADVLPFIVNRLPQEALERVKGVALIGPSLTIDFDISPALQPRDPELPLMPEIKRIPETQLLCIGGLSENQSLCRRLHRKMIVSDDDVEILKGGHAFGAAHMRIADMILQKFGL